MKKIFLSLLIAVFFVPISVSAHAAPTEYLPGNGESIADVPGEIVITFSERLEESASSIKVTAPSGAVVSGTTRRTASRELTTSIDGDEKGTYQVRWSVVSSDDGHFTRGTYSFSVGGSVAATDPSLEIVQITTTPEALAMTMELMGNGVLWASLLIFLLVLRPLRKQLTGVDARLIERGYAALIYTAAASALLGGALQIYVKTNDLAGLREMLFSDALPLYIQTVAGSSTAIRMASILAITIIFFFARTKIAESEKTTLHEWGMIALLAVFAYFRAKVSHATANPFLPDLSLAVNFVHVIEKDFWAGALVVLTLLSVVPRLRSLFVAAIPKIFSMLAIDLALIAVTACYIVWLHLASFKNLYTIWGGVFQELLLGAMLLVALRTYHVLVRLYRPATFMQYVPFTFGIECALATLVVFYSSVVIITSPPIDSHNARSLDPFALAMIGIGIAATVFSFGVYRLSRRTMETLPSRSVFPEFSALAGFLGAAFLAASLISWWGHSSFSNPYKALCEGDGNMWHRMLPMMAGAPTSETPREGCMWGMGNYQYMFPDRAEYERYRSLPPAQVELSRDTFVVGMPSTFTVALKEPDGSPATLFVDMEKLVHVVIVSEDQSVFAHIHADDARELTKREIDSSTFGFEYTFPKAGTYIVAIDYAHGITLESKQFIVRATGGPGQNVSAATYVSPSRFSSYDVALAYDLPFAGEVTTLRYHITKDGKPVTDLEPYLSAAMHVAAVKNDLDAFIHTHGEVHKPGTPYPPVIVKDGKVVHSMAAMSLPTAFGPDVEAHLIFPSAGLYTVWGQFKTGGVVVPTAFTVRVE